MSTHQQSKPRLANHSITEESGRPGTCRSNVGCDAIEEPCTKRTVPLAAAGSPENFSHKKSFTLSLWVQCSLPTTCAAAVADVLTSFMNVSLSRGRIGSIELKTGGVDDLLPFRDLRADEA